MNIKNNNMEKDKNSDNESFEEEEEMIDNDFTFGNFL